MRYPVAIEPGSDRTAFGVVVPDLPGCYSAGDTLDEAVTNAKEAIAAWIDATLDTGERVPTPSTVDAVRERREFAGWIFAVIEVDAAVMDDRVERINITLPRRVLNRLDAAAASAGESRSGFIASMTLVRTEIATRRRKSKTKKSVPTPAKSRRRLPSKGRAQQ